MSNRELYLHGRRYWNGLPLRSKGFAVVAIPMLALLIVTMALNYVQRQSADAEQRVKSTMSAQYAIQSTFADLLDAETGLRPYLQTREGDWPGQLAGNEREAKTAFDDVEAMVMPSQVLPVKRMRRLAEERFALLRSILAQSKDGATAARIEALFEQNHLLLEAIRTEKYTVLFEEQKVLSAQNNQANMLASRVTTVVGLSVLFGLGGGFLALLLFTTSVVPPIQQLAENARRVARRQPLLPVVAGNDEIGSLATAIEEAGALVNQWGRDLSEARAFLEHLIETSPVVMYRRNPNDNSFLYITANAERMLGHRPDEVVGLPSFWLEQIHPDDGLASASGLEAALATGQHSLEQEYRFRHKDGTYRWLYSVIRVEYTPDGRPDSILGYIMDVTERKEAEGALREANAELKDEIEERLRAEYEVLQAKEEAERANRAKSEFLSRMSHELRTPLNAILGFAQLMELDPLPPDAHESVQHILKAGRHLLQLINEVLDIARIEAGRLDLSTEPVPVRDLLEEVIGLMGPLAAQRGVQLSADETGISTEVMADRQRLKQVFLNVLSNAIKYNRTGGRVTVDAVTVAPGRLRVQVTDTGIGMTVEKLGRLFTPFDRLGAEQLGVEGTGIGLTLSKRLMEAMEGSIGAESVVGEGSVFWVELPIAQGQVDPLRSAEQQAAVAKLDSGSLPARTVLYVEDNLPNYRLIERVLAYRSHVKLVAAMQGQLGLELAMKHRPDLILLDMHLPDISGIEVLERLQATAETRGIPVVIISADATAGQVERLKEAGAFDYLTKPLEVNRFLAILDDILQQGGRA